MINKMYHSFSITSTMHHCRSKKMMTYQVGYLISIKLPQIDFPHLLILHTLHLSEANDITSAHSNSTTSKAAASSHAPSPPLNTSFQLPANTDDGCNNAKSYYDNLLNTYISPGDRFWHLGQWITKGDSVLVIDASSGRYAAKYMTATETEVRDIVLTQG